MTIFVLGGFGRLSELINRQRFYNPAHAQVSTGSWSNGQNCTINPIHVALLPSGKIFYLAGSGNSDSRQFGPYEARILDYNTNIEKTLTQTEDLFCAGQTSLADGKILIAGGTLMYGGNPDNCNGLWHGLNAAYELDPDSESLVKVTSMKHGRWYPTLVTLPDGKVWCCSGLDEYGAMNRIIEVFDPSSKSWIISADPGSTGTYCVGSGSASVCPGAGSACYENVCPVFSNYPRAHLMPNGSLIVCGMRKEIRSWNPADGRFSFLANSSIHRSYGTSFLLPLQNTISEKGKILLVGGSTTSTDFATTACEMLDFNASNSSVPVIRNVSPIAYRRKFFAPVILPNGKLLILGGSEQDSTSPVYVPEIFDPVSETWQGNLPPASIPRVYHSVALLLPDGRVWNAGGNPNSGAWMPETQIFSPDYLLAGTRPTISGDPIVGGYGSSIVIPIHGPTSISSVSLVRLMNTTHHYDANQRLVWLQIVSTSSDSITVSAPINANIAPPGYYMIHVLDSSGVPSVAKIIKIPGIVNTPPTPAPTALTINTIPATGPNKLLTISGTLGDSATSTGIADKTITFNGTTGTTAVPPSVTTSSTGAFTTTATTVSTGGQFTATAQFAGDTSYNTASAATTYYVDTKKPTVSITSPANGATFAAGSSITIQASAGDKLLSTSPTNDGQVARVSFYSKPSTATTFTLISTDTTSPYSATISNAAAGSYTLMARATDVSGNFQNSAGRSITVN